MEKKISKGRFGILTLITVLSAFWLTGAVAAPAAYQPNPYLMKDSFSKSPKDASIALSAINGLTVDPFTGAANLSFPLSLPPGRNGMQPSLNLSYSTSYPNGTLGVGRRLDLGYLERSTKDGIPSYGQSDKYIFSLNGITSELVYANNAYYPKIGPENFKFTFDGTCWKAKDKQGESYYFGDPAMPGSLEKKSATEIFRWYLVKVEDPQGNYIRIEYAAGTNYSTLSKIYYTLNSTMGSSYARFSVEFIYEATERNDRFSYYRPGYYSAIPPGRLSAVKIWFEDPVKKTLVRKYTFEYKYSNLSNRSLLTKITEFGSDETITLPPITFT
ncbi:MAG: hypothetical protein NT033_04855, partial [Candidatus Omnitrophica bacterium]|nr:hypothetical protein [Candidatus Omnitrophota bacterium]